ncbi:MAG: efflux RND transporter periplasmic adaptor subunit [Bacteroidota bacterium]
MNKHIIFFLFILLVISCRDEEKPQEGVYYTCSMDPQVIENKPGNCPVCKMPLTKVEIKESDNHNGLQLSDQQVKLGHIATQKAERRKMNEELNLTGILAEDQNKVKLVSSRAMGRIEKLYYKTEGSRVVKGEPLYEIYSEDIHLALKELLLAIDKKEKLENNSPEILRWIASAREKLILYGLTGKQVQQLEKNKSIPETITILSPESGIISSVLIKEGSYVMEGENILKFSDYSTLWAEAEIYQADLSKITKDMPVTITIPDLPEMKISGKIIFVHPELNEASAINLARVEIKNEKLWLKPGMQANFLIVMNEFTALAIPTDAILRDGKGNSIWIETDHHTYQNLMVETGMESAGFTEIKSGLKENDKVVTSGAYLINSEFIFRKGNNPMEGHDMGKM